jgi:hypothetical protein
MEKRKILSDGESGSLDAGDRLRFVNFHLIRALKVDIHRHVEKLVDKDVDN